MSILNPYRENENFREPFASTVLFGKGDRLAAALGLAVEDDQLVSRLLLAGGLALLTLLLMLEAEVQALAGQDAA
ncbi:hypothetical protein, partial [Herbaspirillum huttiense]|uniref:hypothetical protein n=1 Tax=Herbaspirillum huttiense TaxID=863372 RepID=UPI0031E13D5E